MAAGAWRDCPASQPSPTFINLHHTFSHLCSFIIDNAIRGLKQRYNAQAVSGWALMLAGGNNGEMSQISMELMWYKSICACNEMSKWTQKPTKPFTISGPYFTPPFWIYHTKNTFYIRELSPLRAQGISIPMMCNGGILINSPNRRRNLEYSAAQVHGVFCIQIFICQCYSRRPLPSLSWCIVNIDNIILLVTSPG